MNSVAYILNGLILVWEKLEHGHLKFLACIYFGAAKIFLNVRNLLQSEFFRNNLAFLLNARKNEKFGAYRKKLNLAHSEKENMALI